MKWKPSNDMNIELKKASKTRVCNILLKLDIFNTKPMTKHELAVRLKQAGL